MNARRTLVIAGSIAGAIALGLGAWGLSAIRGADAAPRPASSQSPAAQATNPLSAGGLQDPIAPTAVPIPAGTTAVRVDIPDIGVSSDLESLAVDGAGQLLPPVDFDKAGWYSDGVVPGGVGPAIIAGHIDSNAGPAVFAHLTSVTNGAKVLVTLSDGRVLTFQVYGSTQSAKATFPTSEVYGNVPRPELRVITCAGSFDRSIGHYTDNLILFAALVS